MKVIFAAKVGGLPPSPAKIILQKFFRLWLRADLRHHPLLLARGNMSNMATWFRPNAVSFLLKR